MGKSYYKREHLLSAQREKAGRKKAGEALAEREKDFAKRKAADSVGFEIRVAAGIEAGETETRAREIVEAAWRIGTPTPWEWAELHPEQTMAKMAARRPPPPAPPPARELPYAWKEAEGGSIIGDPEDCAPKEPTEKKRYNKRNKATTNKAKGLRGRPPKRLYESTVSTCTECQTVWRPNIVCPTCYDEYLSERLGADPVEVTYTITNKDD